MMDLSDKGSGSEVMNGKYPDGISSEESQITEYNRKSCSDCRTTKTPLWRGGPAGPKTLCNACGIRFRKKRRALLSLNRAGTEKEKKERRSSSSSSSSNNKKLGVSFKLRMVLQRSDVEKQRRRKLGEEEEAAVLLMALSCGSVYAS